MANTNTEKNLSALTLAELTLAALTVAVDSPTLENLVAARDAALAEVKRLARALREFADTPFESLIEDMLCSAMDSHHAAENALRLYRHGYEETYPHPAGAIHPSDPYSRVLSARGRR